MDLQVAAVEDVVLGDDQLRKLGVLVLNGLDRAIERLDDEVEAVERPLLERLKILLVVHACLLGHPCPATRPSL